MSQELRFSYVNADGEASDVTLVNWQEVGRYLRGVDISEGKVKTYRIDRISQYLDGGAALLKQPFQEPPPRLTRRAPASAGSPRQTERLEVCFTGFDDSRKVSLQQQAEDSGLHIVKTVTRGLRFLVSGPTAGWKKTELAREQGVYIVGEATFLRFLETGELPHDIEERESERRSTIPLEEPASFFEHWAYRIGREHWVSFGVEQRPYRRTKTVTRADGTTFGRLYDSWEWSRFHPMQYEFFEGQVFYRTEDPEEFLQVAFVRAEGQVEVHIGRVGMEGSRQGFLAHPQQMAFWLETGHRPELERLFKGTSKAGLFAWLPPE